MKIFFLVMMIFTTVSANALTVDSINFENTVNVAGKELVINGVGIRKATFLKIKVYYGALYLTQKTSNQAAFLESTDPKQIVMQFVRDVSVDDLKKTYREAFKDSNKETYKIMLPSLEAFIAHLSDIKKDQKMIITFLGDGAELNFIGKTHQKVGNEAFSKALLNMYFINPIDQSLANGLLGK